jgi:uncharacterized protein YgfB (UPF0149 family)
MFAPKVNTYVDDQIARITAQLQHQEIASDEYGELLDRLGKLQKIRQEEKPDTASTDTMLMAATNIVGILLIIRHEHLNVITSRAMNMLTKTK